MSFSADFLLEQFATAPDDVAFVNDNHEFTYGWILETTPTYEAFLDETGIRSGDVVAVVADYSPEVFCFILAAFRRGVVLAPLSHGSIVEKDAILEVSQCQWFVEFATELADIVVGHRAAVPDNPVLTRFLERGNPGLLLFSSGSTGQPKGILLDVNTVLEKFRKPRPPVVAITCLLYTSPSPRDGLL